MNCKLLCGDRGPVWAAIIVGTFLASHPAQGSVYYVTKGGNDAYACSQSQPCLTIKRSVSLATKAGDIVQVGAGTYNERVTVTSGGSAAGGKITFRGNDSSGCASTKDADVNSRGARPSPTVTMQGWDINASYIAVGCFRIIGGAGSDAVFIEASRTNIDVIDNFIDASATPGDPGTGVSLPAVPLANYPQNIYVARNYIRNSKKGFWIHCRTCTYEDNEIERLQGPNDDHDYMDVWGEDVTIRHNYAHGNTIGDCMGFDCHMDCAQTWSLNSNDVSRRITFDRNVCFNHHEGIITQDLTVNTSQKPTGNVANWTITNNIFAYGPIADASGNTNHSWCAILQSTPNVISENNTCITGAWAYSGVGTNGTHKNNIHYGNGNPYFAQSGAPAVVSSNNLLDIPGSSISSSSFAKDIVNRDPLFVNVTGSNYHLQAGSPAKDAGVSVPVQADLDGASRPQGAGYDIGAYELGGSLRPEPPTNLKATVH
jgi:hypothetical protein